MKLPLHIGRFQPPELEWQFQRHLAEKYWLQNTVAAISGILLFILFGIVDVMVLPKGWAALWHLRYLVGLPLILVALGFQFIPRIGKRYSGPVVMAAMLAAGITISLMNLYMPAGEENLYFYGLMLVLVFSHVFWRTRMTWPTAGALLNYVIYLGITFVAGSASSAQLAAGGFYYFSALLIFMYAGWFMERQERQAFLMQRELEVAATSDSLTGIANRRAFFTHLNREWRRALREERALCLLEVDIDNMKEINDTGGHAAGDVALKSVAKVLSSHARRPGDLAARLGGDEFVLLLSGGTVELACKTGERIVKAVREQAGTLPLTVSVGVACRPARVGEDSERLIRMADLALYKAKREGRNRASCKCAMDLMPESGAYQNSA